MPTWLGWASSREPRITQIENLLDLAPDVQEAILVHSGSIPLWETQLRSVVRILHWDDQRKALADLKVNRYRGLVQQRRTDQYK